MKGLNSRFSHTPSKRFSNTAHVMGGMVTDGDLTEAGQISQARDEATNAVTVSSGVPAQTGAVAMTSEGPKLRPGWIIAQGKQGLLATTLDSFDKVDLDADLAGIAPLALFEHQVDLPFGPPQTGNRMFYYADLWERPVFASEDADLTDAGLHGAETSYRTRTMVQIKALPFVDEETQSAIENHLAQGTSYFAPTGTATAVLQTKSKDIAVDDCDPCADQITVEQTLPNALWRVEVIDVERNADGTPRKIQLAWSMENAQAVAKVDITSDSSARQNFGEGGGYVFEFFSAATDAQIGRFADGYAAKRPVLTEILTSVPDPKEGAADGHAFTHIRRWDGSAIANLSNSSVSNKAGTGTLTFADGTLKLVTDFFDLDFVTSEREILAGDYWLVEVRRYAAEDDRLTLVGEEEGAAKPYGVVHHFCPLFVARDGDEIALSDAENRQLSFPALSNIPASHVAYSGCERLYGQAENVQDALDELCTLSADQILFDPPDDCPRFQGASNVAEAFEKLCRIEDNTSLSHLLCTMMDWGVVCGMRMGLKSAKSDVITWSGGTILDPTGRLIEVPPGEESINAMPHDHILGDLRDIQGNEGEVCLSVAVADDGKLSLYLSDRATAFANVDPTFEELVVACVERKKRLDVGGIIRAFDDQEVKVLQDMVTVWRNRKTYTGFVPMSSNDQVLARQVNDAMLKDLETMAPEYGQKVREVWGELENEMNPNAVAGPARGMRRMQLESSKLAAIANANDDHRIDCLCLHALPPCPQKDGADLPLVPVGCVTLATFTPGNILFDDLCELCCRKQSMNWRSWRYYFGDQLGAFLTEGKKLCCPPKDDQPGQGGFGDWVGDISDRYEEDPPWITRVPPKVPPKEDPPPWLWPPRKVPPGDQDPPWAGPYGPGPRYPYDVTYPGHPGYAGTKMPNVEDLGLREAEDLLTGNGFDVVQTIAMDEGNPLEAMIGYSPDGKTPPNVARSALPGDKVVLLEQGGKAFGYVAVEEGDGVLPFTQSADLVKIDQKVEDAIANLGLNVAGHGVDQAAFDALELEVARVAGLATSGTTGNGLGEAAVLGMIETAIAGIDFADKVSQYETLGVSVSQLDALQSQVDGLGQDLTTGPTQNQVQGWIQSAIDGIDFAAKVAQHETPGATVGQITALQNQINNLDVSSGGLSQGDVQGIVQDAIEGLDLNNLVASVVHARVQSLNLNSLIDGRISSALEGLDLNTRVKNEMTALIAAGDADGGVSLPTDEVDALEARIAEITQTKSALEADLDAMTETHSSTVAAVAAARAELAQVKTEQEGFVRDMRGAQPIEVSVKDASAVAALKEMGVVSLKDLSDANLNSLKAALRETGVEAASTRDAARVFINQ